MGPTVSLEFKADNADLMRAVDQASDGIEEMADQVGKSTRDIRSHAKAFDAMGEKTDAAESKFTGFKDVLDGGKSALEAWGDESLSTTDKLIAFGQAGADMAGGLTDFLIPAISSMATLLRGGLASAMTFVAAHPLMIVLIALAAVFVLLWMNSEKFRDIVIGVFNTVGSFIKDTFGGAINWVKDAWNTMVSWFSSLPQKIGAAFGALGGIVGDVFKGALNLVIGYINWWVDRINNLIYGINLINPFSDIPNVPHIPRLHTGVATVPGAPGTETLALLQAGERVSTASESSNGNTIYVAGDSRSWLYQAIKEGIRTKQLVIR